MKKTKLLSLIMAIAMILAISAPFIASADDFTLPADGNVNVPVNLTGSITITAPSNITISANEFFAYRLFELLAIRSDEVPNTNERHFVYDDNTEANNVKKFLVWADSTTGKDLRNGYNDSGTAILDYGTNIENFRKMLQDDLTFDHTKLIMLAKDIAVYNRQAAIGDRIPLASGTKTTNAQGQVVFSGVDFGYYLVMGCDLGVTKTSLRDDEQYMAPTQNNHYDADSAKPELITRSMLVNVPEYVGTLDGLGDDPIDGVLTKDAKRNFKGDAPQLDKEVWDEDGTPSWEESADKDIGENIMYRIVTTIPDLKGYDLDTYLFRVKDVLSSGLTLNSTAFTKSLTNATQTLNPNESEYDSTTNNGNTIVVTRGGVAVPVANWTFTATDVSPNGFTLTFGNELSTTPPYYPIKDKVNFNLQAGDVITITYFAKLNKNAIIDGIGNKNSATLEYSNDPDWNGVGTPPTGETPPDEPKVFTYDLKMKKVDGEDNNTGLGGAQFQLFRGDTAPTFSGGIGNAIAGNPSYAPLTFVAGTAITPGVHYRVPDSTETGSATMTTDASGIIRISGLDAGTYWLVETKAPIGYNRLEAPIKIMISHLVDHNAINPEDNGGGRVSYIAFDIDEEDVEDGVIGTLIEREANLNTNYVLQIQNHTGGILPGTGGIGVYVFYGAGTILAALLVVAFVIRRKKNALQID
ncbi:MAG: SpaA isopeptide-forming pilin-related protein [Oscillospiraceae bacterium]|nr:SpaA isopeptide-forming pilin-related protein [Oscillospiraceae bacterium]